jgi:hypothetical protein
MQGCVQWVSPRGANGGGGLFTHALVRGAIDLARILP